MAALSYTMLALHNAPIVLNHIIVILAFMISASLATLEKAPIFVALFL